jgi:hypothetical protein
MDKDHPRKLQVVNTLACAIANANVDDRLESLTMDRLRLIDIT